MRELDEAKIRIILVEDMHMVREALVSLLGLEPDIEVLGALTSGDQILPAVERHRPDVAVIDMELPGVDGITAAAQVKARFPRTRTLILTAHGKATNLRSALAADVDGFLMKDAPAEDLANGIRGAYAGRRVVDSQLALEALNERECPLTARELDVLRLTAQGLEATEIAGRLFLSLGTVRNYLTSISTKLDARNRVDAVRIAQEAEWI